MATLEKRAEDLRKNYDFMLDCKNEEINNLEVTLRSMREREMEHQEGPSSRKVVQLLSLVE